VRVDGAAERRGRGGEGRDRARDRRGRRGGGGAGHEQRGCDRRQDGSRRDSPCIRQRCPHLPIHGIAIVREESDKKDESLPHMEASRCSAATASSTVQQILPAERIPQIRRYFCPARVPVPPPRGSRRSVTSPTMPRYCGSPVRTSSANAPISA